LLPSVSIISRTHPVWYWFNRLHWW